MVRLRLGGAAVLVVLLSCSDSTKPVDPATVASISLTPSVIGVVKGSQQPLALSARDSAGGAVTVTANWSSSAPSVAAVSNTGVVTGLAYGTSAITATVGTKTATVDVVVSDVPVPRRYAVLDLGTVTGIDPWTRHFSDSGDVLARQAGKVYRKGVLLNMPECRAPIALNGPGDVLCGLGGDSISKYAIWRNGTLTPLAAADTFKAEFFRAFALNDSGEVAGVVYHPAFTNSGCAASASCVALWKSGTPTFPGLASDPSAGPWYLNNRDQMVGQLPSFGPNGPPSYAFVYDAVTNQSRAVPATVQGLNDAGWTVIVNVRYSRSGGGYTSTATAAVVTPKDTIKLGAGSASGINNANVVVGTLTIGPFIWRGQGVSLLANASTDPAWTITAVDQINDRGQILATANNSDGRTAHTVILTPTQP